MSSRVESLARLVDRFPFTPANAARKLMDHRSRRGDESDADRAQLRVPDAVWLPFVRRASGWDLARLVRRLRWRRQRASRGFSDRDVWSVDSYLCATLAGMLEQLATTTNGWPGSTSPWPRFEDWQAELRARAAALRRYAGSPQTDAALDRWFALLDDKSVSAEARAAAADAHTDAELADRAAAAEALHWVADNLGYLWD